jgi:hypothetical protein
MAIVLVGICVNGKVRHNGIGRNAEGRLQGGISAPTTCTKCGGKGCPKVGRRWPEEATAS